MKNQKGFIRIPLLIAIIVGVLVFGSTSYFLVKKFDFYQGKATEQAEKIAVPVEVDKDQESRNLEIEKLRKEVDELKNQQVKNANSINPAQSNTISSKDLQPYLSGVFQIDCSDGKGSGSLWKIDGQYSILTNYHVITNPYPSGHCNVSLLDNISGDLKGLYLIYLYDAKRWNYSTDVAYLKLSIYDVPNVPSPSVDSLNFKISSLPKCQSDMPIGSPVVVVGYPAFGIKEYTTNLGGKTLSGEQSALIATNGVISGYDSTVVKPIGKLPHQNYFISAKIDNGNSGGIAFSKNGNSLCVLGIPTWLSIGNYETQGLVQNIYNVMYKP